MVVVDAKCTLMEFLWLQGEKTTVRGWNFFENVLKPAVWLKFILLWFLLLLFEKAIKPLNIYDRKCMTPETWKVDRIDFSSYEEIDHLN